MRKGLLILSGLIWLTMENFCLSRMVISGDYRQTNLDRGERQDRIVRESISYYYTDAVFLHMAHIYAINLNRHRYTWNLTMLNTVPHVNFMTGHYYISAGSGLSIGKKRNGDRSILATRSNRFPFSACASGNPIHAYHGAASGIYLNTDSIRFSCYPFLSYNFRYSHHWSYTRLYSRSSYHSISRRIDKKYPHTEPVNPLDYGTVCTLVFRNIITMQYALIDSIILTPSGQRMSWSGQGAIYDLLSDNGYRAMSLYLNYDDSCFHAYAEIASTLRRQKRKWKSRNTHGWGFSAGLGFRSEIYSLSVSASHGGKNFYSPHASRHTYSHTSIICRGKVHQSKKITIAWSIKSTQKISDMGDIRDDNLSGTCKMEFNFRKKDRITLRGQMYQKASHERPRIKLSSKMNAYCSDTITLQMGANYGIHKNGQHQWNATLAFLIDKSRYCLSASVGQKYRNASFSNKRDYPYYITIPAGSVLYRKELSGTFKASTSLDSFELIIAIMGTYKRSQLKNLDFNAGFKVFI